MWDETKQTRLNQLREAEAQGTLTETERAEMNALIAERCCYEEAAIEEAARRTEEKNAQLEAQVRQIQAQNRELEMLIQEQESYLADAQGMIAQMEERRRDWRERYTRVTGRLLNEPVTAQRGR
jgi:hypothetical protein